MQLTQQSLDDILLAIIDTGGPFDPADVWVAAAASIVNNGLATLMTDVTPATGAVATRVPVTAWGAPYSLTDGRRAVDAPIASFRPASAAQSQVVQAWFLADDAAAGNLLAFDNLADPVPLPNEFAQWSIVVRLTVDPQGRWSAEITWNG